MAPLLDEAERLALELGDERILSRLAGIYMLLNMQKGDLTAARRRLQNTFQQAANRGDHQLPMWLPMLAVVLHRQGLDVWSVTLVGIVLADVRLHLPDPFAGERVFQVLTQVAGRAGRSERGGKVILQTRSCQPGDPIHCRASCEWLPCV